jgi:hypothetical protein
VPNFASNTVNAYVPGTNAPAAGLTITGLNGPLAVAIVP